MKLTEFRKLIREEVQVAVFEQQLTEGTLGDFLSKIKSAATAAARSNYQDAMDHVDVDKLVAKPLPAGILDKAQRELETKSQSIDEGFIDVIRNFSLAGLRVGAFGSLASGLIAIQSAAGYLDKSFNKWYYQYIQGMAESDVMKIMIDLYGAKAAEQSIWLKLGLYAFFVFFTLATLSFIAAYATRKQPTKK